MSTEQAAVGFPVEKLTEPQISDPYPDLLELIINGNGVSLTYHINNLVAIITNGFNPLQTITDNVSGNWSALQKSADAIRKLADYNGAYHQAIDDAMGITDQSWKGNAADNARQFFTTLTDALDAQVGPMKKIADDIDAFALSSYHMANGLAAIVQLIGDYAIQWLITKMAAIAKRIAAAAAASTVVGAPVAAGLTAAANALDAVAVAIASALALQVVKLIGQLSSWVNAAQGLIGAISAAILSAVETGKIPELPAKSYDHPGVI